ncbi:Ig-like domain-containing protein [Maribacter sp. TH_r10]|uniref:Ig-like domain-containing protein n=1 Tax=Maribacter sp. TH_r10 TaxID=3082086 RepID=UPI002953FBB1|nr:Ig-like domain-containing protein [Maribacter sp. TH_r10]MDV7140216.1 Ig-like domain-containing protein [Maribacter sp. TH_r10]
MIVLCIILLHFSCSKDNDLLTDYVLSETQDAINISNVAVDDSFQVFSNTAMVLDVLSNDTFENEAEVIITETSTPSNGTVVINDDETLTYTPNSEVTEQLTEGEVMDTFTYNTEAPDANGSTIADTGSVTIKAGVDGNYLFTTEAKNILKERFEKGYVTGPGFSDDITRAINGKDSFLSSPSSNRQNFGSKYSYISNSIRQNFHYAALYAYATDDIPVANTVMTELLSTVKANSMSESYWDTNPNFGTDNNLWVQSTEIGKLMDSYHLIENIQTVLSNADKTTIEDWFSDYAFHVKSWIDPYYDGYWGKDWENIGLQKFMGENETNETEYQTGYPIEDINGNPNMDYAMAGAQNNFNNRISESIAFLHSWSINYGDTTYEHLTREWFKNALKYGLFPDGTFWELIRNKNVYNINALGVHYSFSTLQSMVKMAHEDAMAQHYPDDLLYDYETTEGILNGSTNLTPTAPNGYVGSSTTDGVTPKSLKTFIMGQSKYYRSSAKGGWNDIRFYDGSPLNMTGLSERDYSIPQAIANLYYKDQDIKDFYLYNTSAGYPSKNSYLDGVYQGSDGAIGKFLLGAAWLEMEVYFFN